MSSGDNYGAEPISTNMYQYICDNSQSHPSINRIEAPYKIRDRFKEKTAEYKGALLST